MSPSGELSLFRAVPILVSSEELDQGLLDDRVFGRLDRPEIEEDGVLVDAGEYRKSKGKNGRRESERPEVGKILKTK